MKKKKPNKVLVVTGIYILMIVIVFILSSVIENGRECFATNPYWNYGLITLPCYFFDSLYKALLNPSRFLLLFIPFNFPTYQFFITALVLNSIFINFLVKIIIITFNNVKRKV